jgi:hypothetical protein
MNKLVVAGAVVTVLAVLAYPTAATSKCLDARVPKANEIIVFGDAECSGPEQTYPLGRHARLEGWSDEISSMRVGSDVKVTIYVDRDLGPKDSSATLWGGNYPHMQWFGDEISSLEVTANGPGLIPKIVMYEHPAAHQNQTIHTVSLGEYNKGEKRHELLLADMMSLITLPQGLKITLYDGHNFEGQNESYESARGKRDINLLNEGWDDKVSSLKIERLGYEMYKVGTWKPSETKPGSQQETIGGSNICKNDANATTSIKCTLQIEYTKTTSTAFAWNANTSITAGVSVASNASVEVPGVGTAGSEVTVSTELTQSFGVEKSDGEETSQSVSASQEVEVKPGEEIEAKVIGEKKSIMFFPEYYYRPVGSGTSEPAYKTQGTITVDMYAEIKTETNVIKNAVMQNNATIPSIARGTTLEVGTKHFTKSRDYYLVLQIDGNLVVYDKNDEFVWGSHNDAQAPLAGTRAELQMSGNFVLLDARGTVIWETGVENPEAVLAIETRRLKVVDQANQTLWPSR